MKIIFILLAVLCSCGKINREPKLFELGGGLYFIDSDEDIWLIEDDKAYHVKKYEDRPKYYPPANIR